LSKYIVRVHNFDWYEISYKNYNMKGGGEKGSQVALAYIYGDGSLHANKNFENS
jgi:hypothetical protein